MERVLFVLSKVLRFEQRHRKKEREWRDRRDGAERKREIRGKKMRGREEGDLPVEVSWKMELL